MPLRYAAAPLLINNIGETATPSLIRELEGVARSTWSGRFASKFRSRREPVPADLASELEQSMRQAVEDNAPRATSYIDALPAPPPSIDRARHETYAALLRAAGGGEIDDSGAQCQRKPSQVEVGFIGRGPRQRKC